jgi:hypothetical protein
MFWRYEILDKRLRNIEVDIDIRRIVGCKNNGLWKIRYIYCDVHAVE